MKRLASMLAISVLSVGSLSACSGGSDYCDKLKDYDADESLAEADFASEEGQQQLIDVFNDLKDSAPSDLEDDYETVASGLETQLSGDPADVDPQQLQELQAAFEAISKDAEENCDVDMQA